MNKTGNYRIKGGKIHRYIRDPEHEIYGGDYLCGIGSWKDDPKTTKPVTYKNCLKRMKK